MVLQLFIKWFTHQWVASSTTSPISEWPSLSWCTGPQHKLVSGSGWPKVHSHSSWQRPCFAFPDLDPFGVEADRCRRATARVWWAANFRAADPDDCSRAPWRTSAARRAGWASWWEIQLGSHPLCLMGKSPAICGKITTVGSFWHCLVVAPSAQVNQIIILRYGRESNIYIYISWFCILILVHDAADKPTISNNRG